MYSRFSIALEICPLAGRHLHGLKWKAHPVGLFHRAGLPITINTDARLIAGTSMTAEFEFLSTYFDFELDDLEKVTQRSVHAAFCTDAEKAALRESVRAGFS